MYLGFKLGQPKPTDLWGEKTIMQGYERTSGRVLYNK